MPAAGKLLEWGRRRLRQAGVEAPAREARVLLQAVSGWPPERLLAHPEAELETATAVAFVRRVERRRTGTPLHYLVGEREWAGLRLRVNPRVLIPRPETELLLERALKLLAAGRRGAGLTWAADLGTGSGALALALALRGGPGLRVLAVEAEAGALAVARWNAERLGVARRVRLVRADAARGLAGLGKGRRGRAGARFLSLVVANPPYVAAAQAAELPREVRREPRRALLAGDGGAGPARRWAEAVRPWLRPGAWLLLETDEAAAARLAESLERLGYRRVRPGFDLAGRPRWVEASWPDGRARG
ncbi:MAG: peptide chain release factor N(5)-glutamine methyltransferase [Firmicutes bacterium]|nr:peptide chain release factor N(5)-glutamine methyltransferase [Bacillota bacterium]